MLALIWFKSASLLELCLIFGGYAAGSTSIERFGMFQRPAVNAACSEHSSVALSDLIQNLQAPLNLRQLLLYKGDARNAWPIDLALLLQTHIQLPLLTLAHPTRHGKSLRLGRELLTIVEMPAGTNWSSDSSSSHVLAELSRILARHHASPLLLLFPTAFVESDLRYFMLQRLFPLDFYNVNAIFCGSGTNALEAYTFEPLIGFSLINRTQQLRTVVQLFPDPMHDVRGYVLRSPVRFDAPRAFSYRTGAAGGAKKLAGIGTYLLQLFMECHNGSFSDLPLGNQTQTDNVHMKEVFDLLERRVIEMSPHLYGFMLRGEIKMSYPVLLTHMCLIAPSASPSGSTINPISSDEFTIWFKMATFIIFCTAVAYCGIFYRSGTTALLSIGRAFSAIVLLLLYQTPHPKISCQRHQIFILAPMFLLGFVISQLYPAIMMSMQTAGPVVRKILTVNNFVQANVQIMLPDYELQSMLGRTKSLYPQEFLSLLLPTNVDTLQQHRTALNSSYAYAVSTERWLFIASQQENAQTKLLHMSQVCLHPYILGIPVRKHSPFLPNLNRFLLRATQYGLPILWQRQAIHDGYAAGILKSTRSCSITLHTSYMCNKLAQFKFLWTIYAAAVACSLVVFIVELALKRFKSRAECRSQRRRRRRV